jgi:hypothetical protein
VVALFAFLNVFFKGHVAAARRDGNPVDCVEVTGYELVESTGVAFLVIW